MARRGILAPMAETETGRAQYRQMSVPQRLTLLQDAMAADPNALSPGDLAVLRMLRARQEQEARGRMPQMPAQGAQPGLFEQLLGGLRRMNPFDVVSDELGR